MEHSNKKRRKIYLRGKRHLLFFLQYIFLERPRGLDFTMREMDLLKESGGRYSGYSKTSEAHLREIFKSLSFEECQSLLDIGCGKGVVLKEAAKYPFRRIDGIELQPELVRTAKKNLKILRLEDKIQCIQADAVNFEGYGEYDTFFLFNPFGESVLAEVAEKIMESRKGLMKPAVIIYHNPRFLEVFRGMPGFRMRRTLHDALKDYDTCIFSIGMGASSIY
ncbi:MAG: methyltransferase domain-containing protein [Kineothrix sp.]